MVSKPTWTCQTHVGLARRHDLSFFIRKQVYIQKELRIFEVENNLVWKDKDIQFTSRELRTELATLRTDLRIVCLKTEVQIRGLHLYFKRVYLTVGLSNCGLNQSIVDSKRLWRSI